MKKFLLLLISLCVANILSAQEYHYFSERKGEIIKTDGSSINVNNLTLMYWEWWSGSVIACYGTSKLKTNDTEIDINKVQSIEFLKEPDGTDYINFYAFIILKSGESEKFLIKRVYNNGYNNPYYSFVGKTSFGIVEVKIWDVKKIIYSK